MKIEHLDEGVGRIVKGVNTTPDVGVDQTRIEAAKFGNTVDKDGYPPTMSKKVKGKSTNVLYNLGLAESFEAGDLFNALEEKWSQKYKRSINCNNPKGFSQRAHCAGRKKSEDIHPNERPIGPETKPTMPSGTIRVKVSDVYDWYKLGQHISDLAHLDPEDFGKGPPEAVISFGSEEEEHEYVKLLQKLGLEIIDVDPKAADAPGVKSDPTYNTESFDTDVEWIKDMDNGGIQVYATKVEDAYIELTYKEMTNGDLYIGFSRNGRSSVTGEGTQNKIFGAVINHIKNHVAKVKPPRIVFSAFKPNTGAFGAQNTTRSSLYRRMVQRFASQNGYDYDVEDTGNEDTFILTRKNINETIRKQGNKYVIYSKDGDKKLGTYSSRSAAEKRLRQIEYFKHANK